MLSVLGHTFLKSDDTKQCLNFATQIASRFLLESHEENMRLLFKKTKTKTGRRANQIGKVWMRPLTRCQQSKNNNSTTEKMHLVYIPHCTVVRSIAWGSLWGPPSGSDAYWLYGLGASD